MPHHVNCLYFQLLRTKDSSKVRVVTFDYGLKLQLITVYKYELVCNACKSFLSNRLMLSYVSVRNFELKQRIVLCGFT